MKLTRLITVALLMFASIAAKAEDRHSSILGNADKDLVKAGGEVTNAEAIKAKKFLFVYFSAHWCPPCRLFTPKLVEFYKQNHEKGNFEVLFISSDHSQKEMNEYMKVAGMPWAGVKLSNAQSELLKEKFEVEGIPFLALLDENDKVLATSAFDGDGYNAGKPLDFFTALQAK